MANKVLCLFNKYGFCKYLDKCRKKHNKEICDNPDCEVDKCVKRHPKTCRYYKEYERCKFGDYCSFKHSKSETNVNNAIVKELEIVKERLRVTEDNIKKKDDEILMIMETLKSLKQCSSTEDSFISENVIMQLDGATEEMVSKDTYCKVCRECPEEIKTSEDISYHVMNDHPTNEVIEVYGRDWIDERKYCIRKWSPFEKWF